MRFIIILLFVIAGIAFAQFAPPAGYNTLGNSSTGLSGTYSIYGTASDGTGIVTNTLTFVDGLLVTFP